MHAPHLPNGGGLEVAVALVISTAGLAGSFATYQSALWGGREALHYGQADASRTAASRAALEANVARVMDVGLFSAWMEAEAIPNPRLAGMYEQRFPAPFKPVFRQWRSQDPAHNRNAAPSPFNLPTYRPAGFDESRRLQDLAEAEMKEAQMDNRRAHAFTRAEVLLAMAMFFGGIGQAFRSRRARIALAGMAVLACAVGLQQILVLPKLGLH